MSPTISQLIGWDLKLRRETWFEIMGQDWSVSLKWYSNRSQTLKPGKVSNSKDFLFMMKMLFPDFKYIRVCLKFT